MRALATRIGINPMTIHYHFKDRDGLIKALANHVYSDVSPPAKGGEARRLQSSIDDVDESYERGLAELLDALDQLLLPSQSTGLVQP